MPALRRSLTNDELQRRLQVALNEGTSNIAQTLVGLNVRTGYTHAGMYFITSVSTGTLYTTDIHYLLQYIYLIHYATN